MNARQIAHQIAPSIIPQSNPLDTLSGMNFDIQFGQFIDQAEFAKYNLVLDSRSCLGRVAQSAAVIEQYFPEADLQAAEVWSDWLAEFMLCMLSRHPEKRFDPTFMQEWLMYEEPHLVILVDGKQFEPLSLQLEQDIIHPKVQIFPVWEAVAVNMMVSQAWLESDSATKLEILQRAEETCPGTTVVSENMVEPLICLGRVNEAREKVAWCLEQRPCARTLFMMYTLTKDEQYYVRLVEGYTEEIVKYF
jgi:hypothetical protein